MKTLLLALVIGLNTATALAIDSEGTVSLDSSHPVTDYSPPNTTNQADYVNWAKNLAVGVFRDNLMNKALKTSAKINSVNVTCADVVALFEFNPGISAVGGETAVDCVAGTSSKRATNVLKYHRMKYEYRANKISAVDGQPQMNCNVETRANEWFSNQLNRSSAQALVFKRIFENDCHVEVGLISNGTANDERQWFREVGGPPKAAWLESKIPQRGVAEYLRLKNSDGRRPAVHQSNSNNPMKGKRIITDEDDSDSAQ